MKLMEMAALTACFEVKTLDCTAQISLNNKKLVEQNVRMKKGK